MDRRRGLRPGREPPRGPSSSGALADPAGALAAKRASRERWSRVLASSRCPGDQRLAEGIDWGKQNLLDLTQRADGLKIRDVDEGKDYPPAARHRRARALDRRRLSRTTRGSSPPTPSTRRSPRSRVGQFEAIEDHARALRDVSVILNGDSGKVAHEIVADGSVYFGNLQHAGNTDETAKFPSLVALIWRWTRRRRRSATTSIPSPCATCTTSSSSSTADGDGWPEGLGNVERTGMGEEKLDNTVYTIRGLYDLADMARAKHDGATYAWARNKARDLAEPLRGGLVVHAGGRSTPTR